MNDKDTRDFMLGQADVNTGSLMNEVGRATRPNAPTLPPARRATGPASPGLQKFGGLTVLGIALWLASPLPVSGLGYMPYAFAALGLYLLIVGFVRGLGSPRPRRVLFRLLPPWLLVWVGLVLAALSFGTPHVMIVQEGGRCSYLGLNGYTTLRDLGQVCDGIRVFPLTLGEIWTHLRALAAGARAAF